MVPRVVYGTVGVWRCVSGSCCMALCMGQSVYGAVYGAPGVLYWAEKTGAAFRIASAALHRIALTLHPPYPISVVCFPVKLELRPHCIAAYRTPHRTALGAPFFWGGGGLN